MKRHMISGCVLAVSIFGFGGCGEGGEQQELTRILPVPRAETNTSPALLAVSVKEGEWEGEAALSTANVDQGTGSTFGPSSDYSTISGGYLNSIPTAADFNDSDYATIGGGSANTAGNNHATVGGGYSNTASGDTATIGGGSRNVASGYYSSVIGGSRNVASGSHTSVLGGTECTASGDYSMAAGRRAKASFGAFVWADSTDADFTSTASNQFAVRASGGVYFSAPSIQLSTSTTSGYVLKANSSGVGTWQAETGDISEVKTGIGLTSSSSTGPIPTLSLKSCTSTNQILKWTGSDWTCQADANSGGTLTSITQGTGLTVTSSSTSPTLAIAPLYLPTSCSSGQVSSWSSSSGWTCVTGGSGSISSVTGTNGITASSNSGAVSLSLASTYTLPQSCADGTLPVKNGATWICSGLLASNGGYTLKRTKGDLVFGADGTVVLYSSTGTTAGVSLAPGSSMWRALSDRNAKRDLKPVDTQAILEQVGKLEISTWKYKEQSGDVDHIGPMAQDFYAAFRVGEDNTHIGTVDADGVNMAAIQGLLERSRAQEATIQMLTARLERLEKERGTKPAASHGFPLSPLPAGVGWVAVGVGLAAMLKRAWK